MVMFTHRLEKMKLILFAIVLTLTAATSYANDISGYNEITRIYANDLSEDARESFIRSLQEAEKDALDKILQKELTSTFAERQYIFRQSDSVPNKLFNINDKYLVIGYEKTLHYKGTLEKSAYVLLFEIKAPQKFSYLDDHLFWKGRSAVKEYQNLSGSYLCENLSVLAQLSDCREGSGVMVAEAKVPQTDRPKAVSSPKTESSPPKPTPAPAAESTTPESVVKDPPRPLTPVIQSNPKLEAAVTEIEQKISELDAKIKLFNTKVRNKADKVHTHSGQDITSGLIMQEYIDASIARDRELIGDTGKVAFDETTDTYVKGLENRIMELETTVRDLTVRLEGVSRVEDTVVFNGVNVQIVNGTGSTSEEINGLGNLIVGYNKPRDEIDETMRTGSHNLVVGDEHNYTSYGGFVAGLSNTISGAYSSIGGGLRNVASGDFSAVSGGHFKTAEGVYSVAQPDAAKSVKGEKKESACFIGQLLQSWDN